MAALCLTATACSNEEDIMTVSQKEIKNISYEGDMCEIDLTTYAQWTAASSADWCKVMRPEGTGDTKLMVNVQANLGDARTAQITLTADGETKEISLTQQGKPAEEELVYKLPIIFHVLYFDPNDEMQNPPAEKIYEMIDKTNEIYRGHTGTGNPDMKLEFIPATHDPRGNLLEEPGIERVQWVSSSLNAEDVMSDRTRKYVHLQWDPNDYINILLFRFSDAGILGISTFPLTPKSNPLTGLDQVEDMDYGLDNLIEYRGLSINSTYVYAPNDIFAPYAPQDWKDKIDMQNSGYITLAHELGHYLGLRHTFSENGLFCQDTDLCDDTPSYDYDEYTTWTLDIYKKVLTDPSYASQVDWKGLFNRQNCQNETFESHNLMDYAYCYLDELTPNQYERVRHVLTYSPLVPGPKLKPETSTKTRTVSGLVDLPHSLADTAPTPFILAREKKHP